ncbi:precorrin-6A/cobalt-precorrin-6A reductase, partial [Mycobacterium avium]|uniref:precorrin-6A/cobalt-precorrin-6A reductase n=1 Tax=Mycobacterium avium TaxID=1764 RepID=UPI0015854F71
MMRLLLLGGTGEARALAKALHPRIDIISSLAGRVPDPALPVGPVRIGGFGGVDGLRRGGGG